MASARAYALLELLQWQQWHAWPISIIKPSAVFTKDASWCAELGLKTPPNTHYLLIDTPDLAAGLCLYLTTKRADFLKGRFVRCIS